MYVSTTNAHFNWCLRGFVLAVLTVASAGVAAEEEIPTLPPVHNAPVRLIDFLYTMADGYIPAGLRVRVGTGSPFIANPGQLENDRNWKMDDCSNGAADGSNGDGSSGNPILLSTGNKVEFETDFVSGGEEGLYLTRTYNHYWSGAGLFGKHWMSNFDYKLTFGTSQLNDCYPRQAANGVCTPTTTDAIWAHRPDGRRIKYIKNVTTGVYWEDKAGPVSRIEKHPTTGVLTLYREDNGVETYSATGYVSTVNNRHGVGWTFSWSGNYLQQVTHTS